VRAAVGCPTLWKGWKRRDSDRRASNSRYGAVAGTSRGEAHRVSDEAANAASHCIPQLYPLYSKSSQKLLITAKVESSQVAHLQPEAMIANISKSPFSNYKSAALPTELCRRARARAGGCWCGPPFRTVRSMEQAPVARGNLQRLPSFSFARDRWWDLRSDVMAPSMRAYSRPLAVEILRRLRPHLIITGDAPRRRTSQGAPIVKDERRQESAPAQRRPNGNAHRMTASESGVRFGQCFDQLHFVARSHGRPLLQKM